ncbi:hypothetical protein ACFL9U_02620 [Thermodesulfobacteriota bacterium]
MSSFTERARRYHEAIKNVLLKEWDPIGLSDVPEAQDEYDAYVSGVYKRLISRSKKEGMFEYLWEIETQHMGLFGNRSHTEAIIKKLMQLPSKIEGAENI